MLKFYPYLAVIVMGLGLRIFRGPNIWYDNGYEENRYHVDVILEPGDELVLQIKSKVRSEGKVKLLNVRCHDGEYVKVHIFLSWSGDKEIIRRPNSTILLPTT